MFSPRILRATILTALLVCLSLNFVRAVRVQAQQQTPVASEAKARGLELYRKGNAGEAVALLREAVRQNSGDAEAWHYLGLAHNAVGETKEARKAFEAAIKLRPDFAPSHTALAYTLFRDNETKDAAREAQTALKLNAQDTQAHYISGAAHLKEGELKEALEESERALKIDPAFAPAALLKGKALVDIFEYRALLKSKDVLADYKARLKETIADMKNRLERNPNIADAQIWRDELTLLQLYLQLESPDEPDVERIAFSPKELTTKARILSKPEAEYTEAARQAHINGRVVMRAVLAFDGRLRALRIVEQLHGGLTEEAIKAARRIKFVPAIKDGHSASQFIQIEYYFYTG